MSSKDIHNPNNDNSNNESNKDGYKSHSMDESQIKIEQSQPDIEDGSLYE
jgi:hypothetical protein